MTALTELTSALKSELARYGANLVGGDTKEGPTFHMVGVGLGRAHRPSLVRRVGAEPGMLLGVTSARRRPWGTRWAHAVISQLGLDLPRKLVDHCRAADPVIELPLAESRAVIDSSHARAGLDLSDGIGGGATIIARSSGVGVNLSSKALTSLVDPELVPVAQAPNLPLACFALSPGYNWENLYAIDADAESPVRSAVKSVGGGFTIIGSVVEDEALMVDGRAFDRDAWPMDEKFVKQHAWEDRLDTWRQKCRTVLGAAG